MDVSTYLAHLEAEGSLLAAAAERAGWDARVPGCPDWTVRDLVVHTGGIHRWAADMLANARPDFETAAGEAVGAGPDDAALLDWFRTGHAALLDTLRAAPADLRCATVLPGLPPRESWARRQAHETAMHRADAEAAAGAVTPFEPAFAQDGMAEMLLGFARRRSNRIEREAVLALHAADGPDWTVTFGGERIAAEPVAEPALGDVTVSGTSSQLYLWLWNRPSGAAITGDESVAALWREIRVRWG